MQIAGKMFNNQTSLKNTFLNDTGSHKKCLKEIGQKMNNVVDNSIFQTALYIKEFKLNCAVYAMKVRYLLNSVKKFT